MKLKSTLLIIILAFSLKPCQAQFPEPYQLRYSTEITLPTISLGLLLTGYLLDKKEPLITEDEVLALDRTNINKFDRKATYNWHPKIAKASDFMMYTAMVSPVLFLAGENSRKEFLETSIISVEVFLLNTGLTYLTKNLADRKRPFLYNPELDMNEKLKSDVKNSFFSGHTSTTTAMSYSFAFMYANFYPDSKAKPVVWSLAAGLPALTGYFRVKAGKHFWTDVIAGYAVGAFTGWLVPYLHR